MDKIYEITLLYDFYGELLTENQKELCRMHFLEDLSFGEISQELSISRQGVYDGIRRGERQLHEYEDALHLVRRFLEHQEAAKMIKSLAEQAMAKPDTLRLCLQEIIHKADDILYAESMTDEDKAKEVPHGIRELIR